MLIIKEIKYKNLPVGSNAGFKGFVQVQIARQQARTGGACAVLIQRAVGGGNDLRVARQAQVIVAGKVGQPVGRGRGQMTLQALCGKLRTVALGLMKHGGHARDGPHPDAG